MTAQTWGRVHAPSVSRALTPHGQRAVWRHGRWSSGFQVEQLGRELARVRYVHALNPGPESLASAGQRLRQYASVLRALGYAVNVEERNGSTWLDVRKAAQA